MNSVALYRAWRPRRFSDVRGQQWAVRIMRNSVRAGKISHGYLCTGHHGSGKTTLARIFAKAINCAAATDGEPCNSCASCTAIDAGSSVDVQEIDAASNGRIDDIRKIRTDADMLPQVGQFKVYILDECHQLSRDAFDVMLKTLEEPPPSAVFLLCTTAVEKVPDTVVSRCMRLDFRSISLKDIRESLEYICQAEGVVYEPAAIEDLSKAAMGSLRDAQSLLEQAIRLCQDQPVSAREVRRMLGLASPALIEELTRNLLSHDRQTGLELLQQAFDHGLDPRQLTLALVERLKVIMYAQLKIIRLPASEAGLIEQANSISPTAIRSCLDVLSLGWPQSGFNLDSNVLLELKYLKAAELLSA